jgi:RNA recognition motif-containing protein
VDDAKLRELFQTFGEMTSVVVMRDDKGASRGFGFVCFANSDDAQKSLNEMNGKMIGSKPLYVNRAQRKDERRVQLETQLHSVMVSVFFFFFWIAAIWSLAILKVQPAQLSICVDSSIPRLDSAFLTWPKCSSHHPCSQCCSTSNNSAVLVSLLRLLAFLKPDFDHSLLRLPFILALS